jgi:hypothetical protein
VFQKGERKASRMLLPLAGFVGIYDLFCSQAIAHAATVHPRCTVGLAMWEAAGSSHAKRSSLTLAVAEGSQRLAALLRLARSFHLGQVFATELCRRLGVTLPPPSYRYLM